ncbi:MAG: DMT family transporter [Acidimicrobiia bacterium]
MTAEKTTREYTYAGLAAVLSANIGWGFADNLISLLNRGNLVVWLHSTTGAIFLLVVTLGLKQKLVWKDFLHTFPIGLQRSIVWIALFLAFQEDNPAIGITVLSFAGVIVILVFGPKLGEKITPKILVLSLIGVIGLLATSLKDLNQFEFTRGSLLALMVLPVSAAGTYILRNVQKKVPTKTAPFYMYMWIAILTTPLLSIIDVRLGFTTKDTIVLILLAIIGAGGHLLFTYSQNHTSFRFNTIASTIHNPMTAIGAWLLLDKVLKVHQIIGMAIVSCVVAYMTLSTRKKAALELQENLEPNV